MDELDGWTTVRHRRRWRSSPPLSSRRPTTRLSAPSRLAKGSMARPGDPSERPGETFAVADSSRDMDRQLECLSSHGVVAWIGGARPATSIQTVRRAFFSQFGIRSEDVKVVQHYPEDFFIFFEHRHHRDAAVAQRDFVYGNIDLRVRLWQLPIHGDHDNFKYHVRLCLEGIPLHAWNESIAKRTVARSCVLDYVEEESLRLDDTKTLKLWAWMMSPSYIPKVTWLTIVGRSVAVHEGDAPPTDRSGLTFRVIVHLDLVEYPPGRESRDAPRAYNWRLGVIDGERTPRDRHDPPPRNEDCRRDDDDSDVRRGRRSNRVSSWSAHLFRSVSRAPKGRERDRSEPRHDHHRDRGSGTGGHRHLPAAAGFSYQCDKSSAARDTVAVAAEPEERGRSHVRQPQRSRGVAPSEPRRHRTRREETPRRWIGPYCNPAPLVLNSKDDSPPPPPKLVQDLGRSKNRFRPGCVYRRRRQLNPVADLGQGAEDVAWSGAQDSLQRGHADRGLVAVGQVFRRILNSLHPASGGPSATQQMLSCDGTPPIVDHVVQEATAAARPAADTSMTAADRVLSTIFTPPAAALLKPTEHAPTEELLPATPAKKRSRRPRVFKMPTAALQKFLGLFKGPLPQEVAAALEDLFKLGDLDAKLMEEALLEIAGDSVSEIQESIAEMQEEARRANSLSLVASA